MIAGPPFWENAKIIPCVPTVYMGKYVVYVCVRVCVRVLHVYSCMRSVCFCFQELSLRTSPSQLRLFSVVLDIAYSMS